MSMSAQPPSPTPASGWPAVSVIMPVLNEERHLLAAVAGILNGTVTQWSDPLIASENADFGLDGLPAIALVSAAIPQGAVDAM